MTTILVIEDHESLRVSMQSCLENEGYKIHAVGDLANARRYLSSDSEACPSLVLLDWMLPDGQGIDFLTELRRSELNMPVIFLTAKADALDKVLALELGANDYMTKPFESRELVARIRARLRDAGKIPQMPLKSSDVVQVGPLSMDRMRHTVSFDGTRIELVKKEFELLSLFAENPERVFSRDEILNRVWGYDVYPTTRTVDTHVMLLRQKIDQRLIETVRAVGYRLKIL